MELVPYHKRDKQLLAQFEKVKTLYVRRAVNATGDALIASLCIPDGKRAIEQLSEEGC